MTRMTRTTKLRSLLPALAIGCLLAAAARGQVAVRILSPEADQPVFGNTEVRIGVQTGLPIDRVEVFLNGKLVGTTKTAPYKVQVDVGEDNIPREFKAVAYTPTGVTGSERGSAGRGSRVTASLLPPVRMRNQSNWFEPANAWPMRSMRTGSSYTWKRRP